jgi:hypothetical protein
MVANGWKRAVIIREGAGYFGIGIFGGRLEECHDTNKRVLKQRLADQYSIEFQRGRPGEPMAGASNRAVPSAGGAEADVSDKPVETHPIQAHHTPRRIPKVVTMRAYEVYAYVFGEQSAMVTGECRGGFGSGELFAFLYARSFPQEEWEQRVEEAFKGMDRR